jgi:hypothetical protein
LPRARFTADAFAFGQVVGSGSEVFNVVGDVVGETEERQKKAGRARG